MPKTVISTVLWIFAGLFLVLLIIPFIYRTYNDYFTLPSLLIMVGFLGGSAFRQMNVSHATSESEVKTSNDLQPWQFSLRRILVAITGVALVFSFFVSCFGTHMSTSSVVIFLSSLIVINILVRFVGTILLADLYSQQ
jgi:hypothetical protein